MTAPHELQPPRYVGAGADDDDAAIIAASMSDPHAFAALYERHRACIARYAASRVGLDHADDIVGDTFVDAFRRREHFDASLGRSALPWLLGIATNMLRRHRRTEQAWLRAASAAGRAGDASTAAGAAAGADDRDASIDAASLAPVLRTVLAGLRRRDRDALVLHVVADLSVEEVAAALGVPPGTVKSRLHRARTLLAARLGEPPR